MITGGSSGIGNAVALMGGARGWSVGVNYVGNRKAAIETVEAVRSLGAEAIAVVGDVSIEGDVVNIFEKVKSEFGRIDGVVVNAGIVAPSMPLAEMDIEQFKRNFEVNTVGAHLCTREAASVLVSVS